MGPILSRLLHSRLPVPTSKCWLRHQLGTDVSAVIAPVCNSKLSRRSDGSVLNAGARFQLDGEEARTGTLLTEHVIGIEQHTAIERETTAADAPG